MKKMMKKVAVIVLSLAMVVGMLPAASSVSASKKTSAIKSENGDVFDFSKGDNAGRKAKSEGTHSPQRRPLQKSVPI